MITFKDIMAVFNFVHEGNDETIQTIYLPDALGTHALSDLAGETFVNQLTITYGDEDDASDEEGQCKFLMEDLERVIMERTEGHRGEGCYWMYAKKDGVWYMLDIVSEGMADKLTATDDQIDAALAATIAAAEGYDEEDDI